MPGDFIIKVCGITSIEDARASVDAGASALGFNFYAGSPRYIAAEKASEIVSAVKGSYLRVGVFVNASEAEVRSIAAKACLDVAQVHGASAIVQGLRTWRAIQARPWPQRNDQVEAYLIDTFSPGFGGSGKTFDWSLAAQFPFRAIVAGGLEAANVAEAIRISEPWGVDACSRLESSPGKKDRRRVREFVSAALSAFHARQEVQL